jgi:hypothetical protein
MLEDQRAHVYRLCVILLVVLSGCAGVGVESTSQSSSPGTVTPVPVPDADRETLRSSGINDSGVTDPSALANAHREWIADRSTSLVSNQTVRYENGNLRSQYHVRLRMAENRTYHSVLRTAGPEGLLVWGESPTVSKFWSNGRIFLRGYGEPVENTGRFTHEATAASWQFWLTQGVYGAWTSPRAVIKQSFESIPTRIDERRTGGDTPRYRVIGNKSGSVNFPFPEANPARNVSLVAEIDETGFVYRLDLQYRAHIDGETVVVRRVISYSDVGETDVGRPKWVQETI